jgi:hypothetical protein
MRSIVKGWHVRNKKSNIVDPRQRQVKSQQQPGSSPDWRGADAIHLIKRSLSGLSGIICNKGGYELCELQSQVGTSNHQHSVDLQIFRSPKVSS